LYSGGYSLPLVTLRDHQQSAVNNMWQHDKGQVIMPTGSGKTITMVDDCQAVYMSNPDAVVVVVAPTIALTNQLSREFLEILDVKNVMHVHSGDTRHFTTTYTELISAWCATTKGNKLVFTTYHSLGRIVDSTAKINTIYFDEAHNSIQKQFFPAVKKMSETAGRCYFFTASPKHSLTDSKPGMNDTETYGEVICEVPTTEMISEGYIVPPTLHTIICDQVVDGKYPCEVDITNLIKAVENHDLNSVLVSCKNTTQLYHLTNSERFTEFCDKNDYTIYSICSRYGCFINDKKVRRDVMFKNMRENTGKFILFHIECLCEGINLPKLDGIILLKKLSTIKMVQSIGRVLRLDEGKTEGKVVLPLYSKYLKRSESPVMKMMELVYEKGQTPVEFIRR
jgi:superfamily II DNA or RNA helicase